VSLLTPAGAGSRPPSAEHPLCGEAGRGAVCEAEVHEPGALPDAGAGGLLVVERGAQRRLGVPEREAGAASQASAPIMTPNAPKATAASTSPGSRSHGSPPLTPPTSTMIPKTTAGTKPGAVPTSATNVTFSATSCPSPASS